MTTHTYYGDLTAKCAASGLTILQMRVVIYYQWVPRAGFDVRDPVMMCAKPSSPCPAGRGPERVGDGAAGERAKDGTEGVWGMSDDERAERMAEALRLVRDAILNADPKVLTDTLWVSDIETAVDCIEAALAELPA